MDDLNAFERQLAGEVQRAFVPARPVDVASIVRTATTQTSRGRFQSMFGATKFVVAAAIVALFGGFLLAGVLTQPRVESVPAAGASASASLTASLAGDGVATDDAWWLAWADGVARIDAATSEMIVIPTASETNWLLPTDDAIWALGIDDIHRIDRATLSVTDSIDIPGGPAVVADGSLWLWSSGRVRSSLVEIDPETRTVTGEYIVDDDDSYRATDPRWISAIDDAIWLHEWQGGVSGGSFAKAGHLLTRFDLETRAFTDRISIDETAEKGYRSCCIAVDDAIWLLGPIGTGTLKRFDVATLEVTDTLEFGLDLGGGIAAAGAIWINGGPDTQTVHRIDPVTKEVTDIDVATHRYRAPGYGDEAIWVAGGGPLSRIDVDSLEVTEICSPPSCGADFTPLVADGVAWLGGNTSDFRVDLVTGEIRRIR